MGGTVGKVLDVGSAIAGPALQLISKVAGGGLTPIGKLMADSFHRRMTSGGAIFPKTFHKGMLRHFEKVHNTMIKKGHHLNPVGEHILNTTVLPALSMNSGSDLHGMGLVKSQVQLMKQVGSVLKHHSRKSRGGGIWDDLKDSWVTGIQNARKILPIIGMGLKRRGVKHHLRGGAWYDFLKKILPVPYTVMRLGDKMITGNGLRKKCTCGSRSKKSCICGGSWSSFWKNVRGVDQKVGNLFRKALPNIPVLGPMVMDVVRAIEK